MKTMTIESLKSYLAATRNISMADTVTMNNRNRAIAILRSRGVWDW